jgi:hypothetical protein
MVQINRGMDTDMHGRQIRVRKPGTGSHVKPFIYLHGSGGERREKTYRQAA